MKHAYYVRVVGSKVKQAYSTLGRANEGAKYRGGKVYAVDVIKGKPKIVCRYYGICRCELTEEEKEVLLWD